MIIFICIINVLFMYHLYMMPLCIYVLNMSYVFCIYKYILCICYLCMYIYIYILCLFYVSCICMLCLVLCIVYLCSLYIWYISYVCSICNIQGLWWTEQVWTSIKGTTNLQPGGGKKDAEVDCNHVQCGSMITENSHVNTDNGCWPSTMFNSKLAKFWWFNSRNSSQSIFPRRSYRQPGLRVATRLPTAAEAPEMVRHFEKSWEPFLGEKGGLFLHAHPYRSRSFGFLELRPQPSLNDVREIIMTEDTLW